MQDSQNERCRIRQTSAAGGDAARRVTMKGKSIAVWRGLFLILAIFCGSSPLVAGNPSLLELKIGNDTYQGKLAARNQKYCWLMGRDGRLSRLELSKVKSFRKVAPSFRGFTASDLRTRLLREFGNGYEVASTRHYLVCASRGQAQQYAKVFEELYRSFHIHFAVRGFKITDPEYPLVALVFPNRKEFGEYCRRDGVSASQGMLGYYLMSSNRVALYDTGKEKLAQRDHQHRVIGNGQLLASSVLPIGGTFRSLHDKSVYGGRPDCFANIPSNTPRAFGTVQGNLRDTVIHEATHQVAFNTGLHIRLGENPKWVVEGLATVFEAPGIRDSSKGRELGARLNRERFVWFQNFAQKRRQPKSLKAFVASDKMFQTSTLDAYSQAWALTYYLIETRPRKYAQYLRTIAERKQMSQYTSQARVDDFEKAFGGHLELFEANFVRYLKRIR